MQVFHAARASAVLILTAALTLPASAQRGPGPLLEADIQYLASDRLQGRGLGAPGADSAAAYISKRFNELGLRQAAALGGWLQRFTVSADAPAVRGTTLGGSIGQNVVGILVGSDPRLAGQYIVIGAHYDHLGLGGRGSLDPDSTGVTHNGADDNASGVVALLEAARRLSLARPARSVLFIAFGGEEHGLLGSAAYVKDPAVPNDSLVAMLNFDMVGRLRDNRLVAYGVETATEWRPLLDSLNASAGFTLLAQGDGYGASDHTSFTVAKRPVLHFFTGTHEDYHRTTDDWEKINLAGIERIAAFASNVTRAVGNRGGGLSFVDLPPPPSPAGGGRSGGYGAYLGTIPDMTENPGGVRISGARGGSPAEKAGLKAGDIIVKIGTHDVPDLQAMTDALRAYQPGEEIEIVVKRDGQPQTLKVLLGRRGGD
jgi:hypothetical protein